MGEQRECPADCYQGAILCRGCGGHGCDYCGHDGREGPCPYCTEDGDDG